MTRYTSSIGVTTTQAPSARRFAGQNRNDTARLIGKASFECTGRIRRSRSSPATDDFAADALAASYVAGQLGAPILLVQPARSVPAETIAALHDSA